MITTSPLFRLYTQLVARWNPHVQTGTRLGGGNGTSVQRLTATGFMNESTATFTCFAWTTAEMSNPVSAALATFAPGPVVSTLGMMPRWLNPIKRHYTHLTERGSRDSKGVTHTPFVLCGKERIQNHPSQSHGEAALSYPLGGVASPRSGTLLPPTSGTIARSIGNSCAQGYTSQRARTFGQDGQIIQPMKLGVFH